MNPAFRQFWTALEAATDAFVDAVRRLARVIAAMSWPALAVASVGLALALAVVPLAMTLFILFLIVKLGVGAVAVHIRRGKATPYRPVDDKQG